MFGRADLSAAKFLPALVVMALAGCASAPPAGPVAARTDSSIAEIGRAARGCEFGEWMPPSAIDGVGVDRRLPCSVHSALTSAVEIAVATLHRYDECRGLFSSLGVDPFTVLAETSFVSADARAEEKICVRAEAYTTVGGRQTGICRSFAHLPETEAAVVLLHEALHEAGLSEWPLDRSADRSLDISALVRRRCGLGSGR